jgi:hypothetical protein
MGRLFVLGLSLVLALLRQGHVLAQGVPHARGIEIGSFLIRPAAKALGAYDNRVVIDEADGDASGDFYSELSGAFSLENKPAMFGLSANGGFGQRFYNEYTELEGDFYHAGTSVNLDDNPVRLGLSAYMEKSLDYDTAYDDSSNQEPGTILTGDTSTRYTFRGDVGYEKGLTDKTSMMFGYGAWHYTQDFENTSDAEWLIHEGSLRLFYQSVATTRMFLSGSFFYQSNEVEDGIVGTMMAGMGRKLTDKTRWEAEVGVAMANYEESGSGQGLVGSIQGNWQITDKTSAYVSGSAGFQPGYGGGGARETRRIGYGMDWQIASRWSILGQVLHDTQEEHGRARLWRDPPLRYDWCQI